MNNSIFSFYTQQGTNIVKEQNTPDIAAPDGTFTSTHITADSINYLNSQFFTPASTDVGKQFTYSYWVYVVSCTPRSGSGTDTDNTIRLGIDTNSVLNYSNRTVEKNKWVRIQITTNNTYVSGNNVQCSMFRDNEDVDLYVWGFQCENGSFSTSLIPTSGAAVTRAADRARITGTPFSDFFNTTEGTLVVQGRTSAGNSSQFTNQPIISIHNGSTTNRIIMFDRDGGTLEWNVISANGSGLLLDETTSYSGAADYIMCGTYENGAPTRAVANGLGADGTTVESSGKNDTVNVFNQMDIGNELGTRQCSSPIKQVRYYPLSLSDAQIKSLVQ
jgi:hypothetical protein